MVCLSQEGHAGKIRPDLTPMAVPVIKTLLQGLMFFLDTLHVA